MRDQFLLHDSLLVFQKQWNLSIYFQLCIQETVLPLELVCVEPPNINNSVLDTSLSVSSGPNFLVNQTCQVWRSLCACHDPHVYLPILSPRFERLRWQLVSRYISWIDQGISAVSWRQINAIQWYSLLVDVVTLNDSLKTQREYPIDEPQSEANKRIRSQAIEVGIRD